MNVTHEITFSVDGVPVTTEYPQLPVREILRMASEASGRDLHDRVLITPEGTQYLSKSLDVFLRHGMKFRTRK